MSQQLPDVQATSPDVEVGLNRVGVTGVEKVVEVARPEKRPVVLMADFEVYVDLPSWRKGADMSRNMEVVDEILRSVNRPTASRMSAVTPPNNYSRNTSTPPVRRCEWRPST